MCVSDSPAIKVINTVNQGIERKFVNKGRLNVIEPAQEERETDGQTDRQEREMWKTIGQERNKESFLEELRNVDQREWE